MKKTSLLCAFFSFIAVTAMPVFSGAQVISTFAGCGIGDDSLATKAELVGPNAMAFDNAGNSYIADAGNFRVRKITASTGVITTFAGNGVYGNSGDGGPATAASLGAITGLALDRTGNVYLVDEANNCIRKVNTSGIISTIAGTGTEGFSGDGGPATIAKLNRPTDILVDTSGNVLFADWYNARVRKIDTSGIITTIVGTGGIGTTGNHGPAVAATLGAPFRIAMDNKGNLYVAEVQYQHICKVDTAGILTIIGDTTGQWVMGPDGDGGLATEATMTSPCGLALDTFGNLYFSDIDNERIRKIDLNTGIISAFAATGVAGYSGDGGAAASAQISTPEGLASDASGNIYISDADNNTIRKITSSGTISTFAGQCGLFDEGYPAVNSEMCAPSNLCTDPAGNIYVADYENNRVRKIDAATGAMTTVAGNGIAGYEDEDNGDGGAATSAHTYKPYAVAVDAAGNMYIADVENSRVRKVNTSGIISTFAGTGIAGFTVDGGPADTTELNYPTGVAVDAVGNVYIADESNSRIRKVDTAGIITTVAGTFSTGYTGDGGPATSARLSYPTDVAVDGIGNMYIVDGGNNCIRKVDTAGIIHTITNYGAPGFSGDGGPDSLAQINQPFGIKADSVGDVVFVDAGNQRVRVISAAGIINTVAGNGTAGFSGDGGPALSAMLNAPGGVALDKNGNLYIGDGDNFRIRKVNIQYLTVPSVLAPLGNIQVYPNPAHSSITIQLNPPLSGDEKVTLFNAIGQEVYSAPLISVTQSVNIANLANGIYMVQITNRAGDRKITKVTKD